MLGKENNGHTLQQEKYLKNPTLSPPSDEMRGEAGETFDSDRIQFSRQSRQHLPHDNQTETDSIHHQPFSDKMTNRQSEKEEEQKNIMTKHLQKKSSECDLVKFRYFCILKRGLYVFQFQSAIFTAKQKTMDVNRMFKCEIHLRRRKADPVFPAGTAGFRMDNGHFLVIWNFMEWFIGASTSLAHIYIQFSVRIVKY